MVGGMPSSQFPALGSTRRVHSSPCITWLVYQSSPSCTTAAAAAAATIATITTTNAWSTYLFSVARAGTEGPPGTYLCVRVSAKQPPESYRPAGMVRTPFRNFLVNDFPRFDSAVRYVPLKTTTAVSRLVAPRYPLFASRVERSGRIRDSNHARPREFLRRCPVTDRSVCSSE